jgi:N-acetylglucosamine repressor
MSGITTIRPETVGKLNERQVLRVIQAHGSLSRAEVVRESGLSAPTVSKAVLALLKIGFLEETQATEVARGRPAPKLRLASQTAQVLGVVIDAAHCEVVSAGLNGQLHDETLSISTPASYEKLLNSLESALRKRMNRIGVKTLGLGVSLPGLVDYRKGSGVLSPNVPITDGHTPALDLAKRLGLEATLLQESHALCLGERYYGDAKNLDDFAILDVGAGVGLGVMSGGRILKGHSGLAGEIGHMTVVAHGGRKCGCGNTGCLETVASDSALAWHASRKLNRTVDVDEVIGVAKSGQADLQKELREVADYVAIAVATVMNLFNPATVFIHTPLFEIDPKLFAIVEDEARNRALKPTQQECQIRQAKGRKRQGAVAGIIQYLTDAVVPELA